MASLRATSVWKAYEWGTPRGRNTTVPGPAS